MIWKNQINGSVPRETELFLNQPNICRDDLKPAAHPPASRFLIFSLNLKMKNSYFFENCNKLKPCSYSPTRGFRKFRQIVCFIKHGKTTKYEKLIPAALPISKQKRTKPSNFTKSEKYNFWRKYLLLKVNWNIC